MRDGVAFHASVCCLLISAMFTPVSIIAAPLNMAGSVSINSTTTQVGGITSNSKYISGSVSSNSYIYQPWLVTWAATGSLSRSFADSAGAQSRGAVITGSLQTSLLPRSRFPLSLEYRITDSAVQVQAEASPDGSLTDTRTSLFAARSNISMRDGAVVSAWYNRADWESTGTTGSRSRVDSIGANTSWRSPIQSVSLSGSAFKTENYTNATVSENANVSASHNLSSQPQSGLTTLLTYSTNSTSTANELIADSSNMNATSNFSWRPDYRPISVAGGVTVRDSQTVNGAGSQNLGVNLGLSYAVSRSVRTFASLGGAIQQSDDARSVMTSQALGVNYIPETIYLGKSVYNWGAGLSLGNSTASGVGGAGNQWSLNGNLNHGLSRSWQLAQRQVLTLSGAQSVAMPWREDGLQPLSLSNNLRTNWSHSGDDSTTTAWVSLSDSRPLSDGEQRYDTTTTGLRTTTVPATQILTGSLRRTQNLNRLSSLSADISVNARRQSGKESQPVSTSGSAEYNHARLFGIYQMRFISSLGLSQASSTQGAQTMTSRWDNRINYSIGMMTMAASFSVVQSARAESRTLTFQVTRRF